MTDIQLLDDNAIELVVDGNAQVITSVEWGEISGTLSNQTDLQDALELKANANEVYTKDEADELLNKKASASELASHIQDDSNPHNVTKAQVGLGNVDNTSDLDKPISNATQNALDLKATTAQINNLQSQIDLKENTSNKVTSLNASSTDTQYPSAKCVYDNIPTNVSQLNNDSGYLTLGTLPIYNGGVQ